MHWSDLSFSPPRRTLRQFAGLWLVFFSALAAWQYLRDGSQTLLLVFAVAALAVGPIGLVLPQAVRPVFVGAMVLAFPIGWVVSRVLLALLYFGLFTPIALVFKLSRRDVLALRPARDSSTYWTPKLISSDVRGYLRQF